MGLIRSLTGRRTETERYLERGLFHLDDGSYNAAIADLTEAIYREGYNAELYTTRGFVYMQADDPDFTQYAQQDFEYALYLDPGQMVARYCLGMMAYGDEDWDEALKQFTIARDIAPLRPEIYYYRALCYYQLEDYDRAMKEMELAMPLFEPSDRRHLDAAKWAKEFKKAKKSSSKKKSASSQNSLESGSAGSLTSGYGRSLGSGG